MAARHFGQIDFLYIFSNTWGLFTLFERYYLLFEMETTQGLYKRRKGLARADDSTHQTEVVE